MIAVMVKEWRRLIRASSTPWALLVYLLAPVAIAAYYLQLATKGPAGLMAQQLPMVGAQALTNVATWQLLLLGVATPWIAASALASEVEDRTLDPLLAGGGRLPGLVAGKLLAVILFMWTLIVAALPAFALPLLVGGINLPLLLRVVGLELATAVFMSGAGLAISAFGRRSGSVALAGVALGLALTLGTGMAAGMQPGAGGVYNREVMIKMAAVGQPLPYSGVPKWLYVNPLVGLNSALNNTGSNGMNGMNGTGASSMLTFPGVGSGPVYKTYRLWQVQLVGAAAGALACWALAWTIMFVRLRWRRPRWTYPRARKAVTANG